MTIRHAALCLTLALAAQAAPAQPVQPGQAFPWQQMDVRAPATEGWVLVSSSPQALAFVRRSEALARSEVATVSVFALPETLDREGFVAWVRAAVQAELPATRFRVLDSGEGYSEQRGHACVEHRSLSQDLQARGLPAGAEPPALQQLALYCRHPGRAGSGFAVAYSTRGPGVDDTLAERARNFIDGVTPRAR